jgi:hypothetical protein
MLSGPRDLEILDIKGGPFLQISLFSPWFLQISKLFITISLGVKDCGPACIGGLGGLNQSRISRFYGLGFG